MKILIRFWLFCLFIVTSGCCLVPKEVAPCPALPYLCATPPRPQFSVWMLNASTNTMTCIVFAPGYACWFIRYGKKAWEYYPWERNEARPSRVSHSLLRSHYEDIDYIASKGDTKCSQLGAFSFYRPAFIPEANSIAFLDVDLFFSEHPSIRNIWIVTGTDYHSGFCIVRNQGIVEKTEVLVEGYHPEFNSTFRPVHILLENGSYYEFTQLGL